MSKKRALAITSSDEPEHNIDFFNLNELESTKFWRRSDAADIARNAIEILTTSRHGIADYIKDLRTIMLFVEKVYSTKSSSTLNESFMKKVFHDLQHYDSSNEIDGISIKLYLASCILYSSNFSANLRSILIRTLVSRHLLPTIEILAIARGGQKLMIDWQRKLLETSESITNHISSTLHQLLEEKKKLGGAMCDSTLQAIVELSSEASNYAPMTVWNEIWKHVCSKPTVGGKKLALALLNYAAVVNSDLYSLQNIDVQDRRREIPTGSCTSIQQIDSSESVMSEISCLELLPLLIVCHTEKDISIISTALQIIASNAHNSVIRWGLKTKSQLPFGLWASALKAVTICLTSVNIAVGTHKLPQHKILCTLNQILLSNPFGRNFGDECTAQQALDIIIAERMDLNRMRDAIPNNPNHEIFQERSKTALEIIGAIEFLSQELAFVSEMQSGCYPAVLIALARGSVRGIASRTLSVIETILRTTCCGVDPLIVLQYSIGLPDEINTIVGNVLQTRCTHAASFLEVAASAIDSTRGARVFGCRHIQKSSGHRQLLQLSRIFLPSSAPSKSLQADAAMTIRFLVEKLSSDIQANDECDETKRSVLTMLLTLSVMPIHYDDNFSKKTFRDQLEIICESFFLSLKELKCQTLDGSKDAAFHCTVWLLFLAQLKKCTNSACFYMGSTFELTCLSHTSLACTIALIYPDMLGDTCVMPSAIVFAMQQREPLKLLFESIGSLQDSAFDSERTNSAAIIHYSTLIATVVLENSKVVKNLVRERYSVALSKCDSSSESMARIVDQPHSIYSTKGDSLLPETEEDFTIKDYMNKTNLLERADQAEMEDLETSVNGDNSFLACFLPLFKKLLVDEDISGEIRVSALRTLSVYIRCSKKVLRDHVQLLETYITTCGTGHPQQLRLEALLVWVENFDATPVNVAVPIRGLINSLKRLQLDGINEGRLLERSSEDFDAEQLFVLTTIRSMHCLITEKKLRDPAEYALAIGMLYAIEKNCHNSIIGRAQEECCKILLDIFVRTPSLLTRTLYQLCLPMQPLTIDEKSLEMERVLSVSNLIVTEFDQRQRLRIVCGLVQIARSEDILIQKLDDVDQALTDQVIRGHNSFALAALDYFDITAKSVKAIKEAIDLSSFNNLDPTVLSQLRKRLKKLKFQELCESKEDNDEFVADDYFKE